VTEAKAESGDRSVQPPVQDIIVIAAPRSGTNFFCECMGTLSGVAAYFEIFNPGGVMGAGDPRTLEHLSKVLGRPVNSAKESELVRFFRTQPLAAVEELRACAREHGEVAVCYKVFPGQIPDDALRSLLMRPEAIVAMVVRRRLDTYISYQNARRDNVWKNRDTSNLFPSIDLEDFLSWAERVDSWYEDAAALARSAERPICIFDYDQDINVPKPELVANLASQLKRLDLDLRPDRDVEKTAFRKQDKRAGPFKKISNADELRAQLRSRRAYNYALTSPLSDAPKPKAKGSAP
jgi:hypothetical protein